MNDDWTVKPPSTLIVAPVMYRPPSPARCATVAALSAWIATARRHWLVGTER